MPLPKQPTGDAANNIPAASPVRGLPRIPPLPVASDTTETEIQSSKSINSRTQRGSIPSAPILQPEANIPARTSRAPSVLSDPESRPENVRPSRQIRDAPLPEVVESLPDDLSSDNFAPQSSNQGSIKPAERSVYDELEQATDEDEDAILNRLLGLDEDEEIEDSISEVSANVAEDTTDEDTSNGDSEDNDDSDEDSFDYENSYSKGVENNTSKDIISSTDDEDEEELDFDAIMRDLEATSAKSISSSLENDNNQDEYEPDIESVVSESDDSKDGDEESDESSWKSILNSLGAEDNSVPDQTVDDLDDKTEERLYDDDEEDADFLPAIEENFVPPVNPFANPYEEKESSEQGEDTSHEDEVESTDDEEEEKTQKPKKIPKVSKQPGKLAELLSVDAIKNKVSDYLAGVKAELHGEAPPAPKNVSKEDDTDNEESLSKLEHEYAKLLASEDDNDEKDAEEDQDESTESSKRSKEKSGKSNKGRGKGIFGFLAPVKSLYMGIVNLIFGVISGVLGILAKLPLIGFIFSAALGATNILKGVATYLPLVFVIGALAVISYFSVPREANVLLPDSGSAALTNLSFDSEIMTATGTVTNTGETIANVTPEVVIYSIQPALNPKTWFIPSPVATCSGGEVSVDIDVSQTVDMACSGTITGYIPRVGGVLK